MKLWPKIILVNLILIVFAIAALELCFGAWLRDYSSDYFLIPRNASIKYDVRFGDSGWQSTYRRDAHGLRGTHAHPREIDMLTLGGSTTDQRLLELEQTWSYVLQERLARTGRRLVVGNAGVDGHSTVGHLRSVESWLARVPELKPKWVILYVGINDRAVESADSPDPMDGLNTPRSLHEKIRAVIVQKSALYALYRAGKGIFIAEKYQIGHGFMPPLIAWTELDVLNPPPASFPRLDAYARRLDRLIETIRQRWDARIVFVTQPLGEFRVADGRVFARNNAPAAAYILMRQYNDVLMDRCRHARQICIDLAHELDLGEGDFYDHLHTTPRGSRKIGEFLAQRLTPVFSIMAK